MSEVVKPPEGTPPAAPDKTEERIKNLQAEFTRKLDNTNSQLNQLLTEMKTQRTPAKPPADQKQFKDVIYDDPDAAAAMIAEQVSTQVTKRIDDATAVATKKQSTLHALALEYPELQQGDSDLAKRAVEVFNEMPIEDQANPSSYRTAVLTAASEQGVKPKSKRKQSQSADDAFALGGSGGGGNADRGRPPGGKAIEQAVDFLAQQMGVKMDDKVKERVQSKHGRRTYGEWK